MIKQGPIRNRVKSSVVAVGAMPSRGDNVTMQQLMETMRTLQETVTTSRGEIAASQADNEELRRTNEELRRDLQQAGERAVDERAPPIPLKARPIPFSQAIMDTVLPVMSLGPKVTFTGVENSEAHLTTFHTQMVLTGSSDGVYCKLLMSTLAGATLEWFVSLPNGHITTFDQFVTLFRNNTSLTRPPLESLMMSSILNSTRESP